MSGERRFGQPQRRGEDNAKVHQFLDMLRSRGRVVAASKRNGVEVRYSDGWTEKVSKGRYLLIDPSLRIVIDRPGRPSDVKRLDAVIDGARNP